MAIVYIGSLLSSTPTWQAIAFAILGAILQTAVLGLIYEIFLRTEVEDATREKLGFSRDARDHGLVRIEREAVLDWSVILDPAKTLCVVSRDPRSTLGMADDQILRRAAEGYLRRFTIVVPKSSWRNSERWLSAFKERWRQAAPNSEFFAVKADQETPYELVGTDTRSIVLLPRLSEASGIEATKLLEFRSSETWGIGGWLQRQSEELGELSASIGHSPPPAQPWIKLPRKSPTPPASESEEIT